MAHLCRAPTTRLFSLGSPYPQMFATPKRHHKSKPFFDHVTSFSVADGRIWLRNYQARSATARQHSCTPAWLGSDPSAPDSRWCWACGGERHA